MKIAARVSKVKPSATLAVSAKAKQMKAQGIDVVGFGAGEPDFDTPQYIKNAAVAALAGGDTKYNAKQAQRLKELICKKLREENGLEYSPDQVLVSNGAKHSCYNLIMATCEEGDEILIPAPYWVSYPEMAHLAGAAWKAIATTVDSGFKLTPEALEQAITPRTKLLIFNSPSNPTGATYTPEETEALAAVLKGKDLLVMSDEIYDRLIYDGQRYRSLAACAGMYEKTVTINGHSKTFAMTGWRIGYLAGPKPIVEACDSLQSHATSDANSFAQAGAAAALADPAGAAEIEKMRQAFDRRRKLIVQRLRAIPGVKCPMPSGAFYVFPDVSAAYGRSSKGREITDSLSFTQVCLEEYLVALVPGVAFGADRCVRLSYATSEALINKGLDRLERMFQELE